jgi:hypothetical protein
LRDKEQILQKAFGQQRGGPLWRAEVIAAPFCTGMNTQWQQSPPLSYLSGLCRYTLASQKYKEKKPKRKKKVNR